VPFAEPFRREERLGCLAQRLFVHAFTGVGHAEANVETGLQSGSVAVGNVFRPRGHDDLAAAFHGVAGVHGEIEQRHFQLVRVGLDRPQRERETHLDPERWAQRPLKQIRHAAHEFGDVDRFLIEFLVSREREHALGQGLASLRALHGVFKQRRAFGVVGQALAQKLETAEHRGQQVVEIMGDAAGELADRFHLLRLTEISRAFSSFSYASLRSVMSRVILAKPTIFPSRRMASMTTCAHKREPSLRTRQPSASNFPSRAAVSSARAGRPVLRSSSV
jgi:hypothetical protein